MRRTEWTSATNPIEKACTVESLLAVLKDFESPEPLEPVMAGPDFGRRLAQYVDARPVDTQDNLAGVKVLSRTWVPRGMAMWLMSDGRWMLMDMRTPEERAEDAAMYGTGESERVE
jgi:hypothetical protein